MYCRCMEKTALLGTASKRNKTSSALPGQLLNGLAEHEIDKILAAATTKRFEPHDVILRTGEPAKHLYLLQKGEVKFYRVTTIGQEIMLGLLIPNEAFGLNTLLGDAGKYIGTAESIDNCEMRVWGQASIRKFATLYPRLAENVLRISTHYAEQFADRLTHLASSTAEQRLARTLSRLAARSGKATSAGLEVKVKNETLASLAVISVFTVSRHLNRWERRGAIRKLRGRVLIQHPEKLLVE